MADGDLSSSGPIAEWLTRARSGDAAARERLFTACRSYVATVARCHLQRGLAARVDASDIVQQSLLEAHRGFDRFAGESPAQWLAWLRGIATHNALDAARGHRVAARRAAGRERSLDVDSAAAAIGPVTDSRSSPSQRLLRWEREMELAAAHDRLPEDHRRVIELRNIERLPFEEVARRMDRSAGACRMLWMRALESLRGTLGEDRGPTRGAEGGQL
jgi:RNA polymerase sigma-70 factor (ECF subfamily)